MRAQRPIAAALLCLAGSLVATSCIDSPSGTPATDDASAVLETKEYDDSPIESGGATGSYRTCEDMFIDCAAIGGGCTRGFPGCSSYGLTPCGACLKACKAGVPYPPACRCFSCGFE